MKLIRPDKPDFLPVDDVLFAGTTGFLHILDSRLQWTTYANGHSTDIDLETQNGVYSGRRRQRAVQDRSS